MSEKVKAWLRRIFALPPRLRELRSFSYIAFAVERLFFCLQLLSPCTWTLGSRRRASRDAFPDDQAWREFSQRRARDIEYYICACAALVVLAIWLTGRGIGLAFATIFVTWRIGDIVQTAINVSIFDYFRVERDNSVASVTRSIVLSAWNYAELIVCYGVLYAAHPGWLDVVGTSPGPYYFSAITQLTIGYGDIKPLGLGRFVATTQALAGLAFLALVFARFVAVAPRITTVHSDERP
ncbi:MAG TPA: ion channel [Gemmatimonadaceae bacterium]|jgi:potassium channel LctB